MYSETLSEEIIMKVQVINNSKQTINQSDLVHWVGKVRDELKDRCIQQELLNKNLILAFVNEEEIQKLNKTFRHKDSITDVLSFSAVEEDSLGELVFCLSVIDRKKPEDFSKKEWLYYLVLHGILHLLGFEHESGEAAAQKMYQLQDDVFSKLMEK